jgi:hypothetical protein
VRSNEIVCSEREALAFWSKVALPNEQGCMLWLGSVTTRGYGLLALPTAGGWVKVAAHRLSYTLTHGPIPMGLVIDHVRANGCTNKHCVAPLHLEAVTQRENTLRGRGPVALNARKTHCPQGHPYSPENTYAEPQGGRKCRRCLAVKQRNYLKRKRST